MPYFSLVDFDPIESTPLIMNHHEILIQIQSYQTMFTFLIDSGLLAAGRECNYGQEMVLRERPNTQDISKDRYHWNSDHFWQVFTLLQT